MDNEIQVFWIYTETGHGKGPMDGVGAAVKKSIKDTLAYNPDKVIRNTEQLMQHLPDSNIIITTYNQNDVEKILSDVPSPDKFEILHNGFGVSQVHEIFYNLNEDKCIKWKKLSSDSKYSDATIKIKETVFRK